MMSKILLGLGLVFEMPMLMFFLARIGIVTARQLAQGLSLGGPGHFRDRGGDHSDAGYRHPNGLRRAHDPALSAWESWWRRSSEENESRTSDIEF